MDSRSRCWHIVRKKCFVLVVSFTVRITAEQCHYLIVNERELFFGTTATSAMANFRPYSPQLLRMTAEYSKHAHLSTQSVVTSPLLPRHRPQSPLLETGFPFYDAPHSTKAQSPKFLRLEAPIQRCTIIAGLDVWSRLAAEHNTVASVGDSVTKVASSGEPVFTSRTEFVELFWTIGVCFKI